MTTPEVTAGHAHAAAGDDHVEEAHDHHVCSIQAFIGVFAALLFLTFVTVWVSLFDFGGMNMFIAMAVAAVKASLVMAIFMHLIWDTTINKLFFLSSFLFLGLLFLFSFADLLARSQLQPVHGRTAPLDYKNMPEQSGPGTALEKFHKQWEERAEHTPAHK